jgi:hypothetical protein
VGEAQDPKTEALKTGVPSAVAFEGVAVPVVTKPIRLDDQSAIPPEEVDFVRANPDIYVGPGKPVTAAKAEEASLQLATGDVWVRTKIAGGDQAEIEPASHRGTKHRLGNGPPQIAEGPPRLGNGDAVAAGRNCGCESGGAVDSDAHAWLSAGIAGNRDVNVPFVRREQPPDCGGTPVARDCPPPKRKNRGDTAAFEADSLVSHRVDTTMKPVQTTGAQSGLNRIAVKTSGAQLVPADDAVLPTRHLGDHLVASGALFPHTGNKAPTPVSLPFVAGFRRP